MPIERGEPTVQTVTNRIAASMVACGFIAASQLLLAPTASADGHVDCDSYPASVTSDIDVATSPAAAEAGDVFTATATVTTDGQVVNAGTVTFDYLDASQDDAVNDAGVAAVTFTAGEGVVDVAATFTGACIAGVTVGPSSGIAPVVAGVSETLAMPDNNAPPAPANPGPVPAESPAPALAPAENLRPPVVAGVEAFVAALPDTGLGSQINLFALLGLGLVSAGAATLILNRRRTQT